MIEGIFDNALIDKDQLYLRGIAHARYRTVFANMCVQNREYKEALKLVLKCLYYNLLEIGCYKILLKVFRALICDLLRSCGLQSEIS